MQSDTPWGKKIKWLSNEIDMLFLLKAVIGTTAIKTAGAIKDGSLYLLTPLSFQWFDCTVQDLFATAQDGWLIALVGKCFYLRVILHYGGSGEV